MKKTITLFSFFFSIACVANAQLLQEISARDVLADVVDKAKSDLASDSYLTSAFFAGLAYQGVSLTMNIQTGKANGWLYRIYSPALDSILFFLAVKPLIGGVQVIKLPVDTITQYLPINIATSALLEPWVDSPEALTGSKNGGAATYLSANPSARISLALILNNPAANAVIPLGEYWFFRYVAPGDTLTCLVWGDSGNPLRCGSSNAPRITSIPRTIARAEEPYEYDVNAYGSPDPVFTLLQAPTGMSIDSVSGLISWTPTKQQTGLSSVTVQARNTNGDDEQSFQINVQAVNATPAITSTAPVEVNAGDTYVYQVTATGSPQPSFHLLTPPSGMIIDSGRGSIIWTPTRGQKGAHAISVLARNSVGEDRQDFTLTVFTSPKFSIIPRQTAKVGEQFTLTLSADAFPSPTYVVLLPPSGMAVDANSGVITWTPSAAQFGLDTIYVQAINRAGMQQHSFEIQVDNATPVEPLETTGFAIAKLYPNPVHSGNTVVLHISGGRGCEGLWSLTDILGRTLSRSHFTTSLDHETVTVISSSGFAPGLYALHVRIGVEYKSRTLIIHGD